MFELWDDVCGLCVGMQVVYGVYGLCVGVLRVRIMREYVSAGAGAPYMHYVSVGVFVVGFGCEGYCSEFENGKDMVTKYACTAGKIGARWFGCEIYQQVLGFEMMNARNRERVGEW